MYQLNIQIALGGISRQIGELFFHTVTSLYFELNMIQEQVVADSEIGCL